MTTPDPSQAREEPIAEPVGRSSATTPERTETAPARTSSRELYSADPQEEDDELAYESAELVTTLKAVLERHSGPLPHPSLLSAYREIDPRVLDWVLESATRKQQNRHWCEREPLRQAGVAQIFAFAIVVVVVLVGGFLILEDKSAAGLATILVPLASLLGIFVYREIQSVRNRVREDDDGADEDSTD